MPSPYYPFMSLTGFFFLSPRPPLKKKKENKKENVWSQVKETLKPHPDWSPEWIWFKISDKNPRFFDIGVNPPPPRGGESGELPWYHQPCATVF